jgi:hypothetical protein
MRAEYEPTDAQRALVENAAAFGLTQADIEQSQLAGEHYRRLVLGDVFRPNRKRSIDL